MLAFCDYYGFESQGGTEVVAAETYRRMVGWGAEVTVVSASRTAGPAVVDEHGVRVVGHPCRDLTPLVGAQVNVAPGLVRRAVEEWRRHAPDVLHANNLFFQTALAAARLQRRVGVPLVTTAHIAGLDGLSPAVRVATKVYERTAGRFIIGRSAAVIAVSHAVKAHLAALGVGSLATVIPNGVDGARFHPRPSAGDRRPGPPVVAIVGRLIANKGPGDAVEAFARLHAEGTEFRGVFIGDGPLRPALETAVGDAGLDRTVQFTGHVTDVADRLRQADVLVRPSSTEGMPLAVLEAMASGLCVVASDIPGNAELITDGRNGLLYPRGDIAALTARLRRALADEQLRGALGAAAYETAARHSWDECAASTGAVLQATAAPRRPPLTAP